MAGKFYVYVHKRADNGVPFYVGKGQGKRANVTRRNRHWTNIAKTYGHTVEYLYTDLEEAEAFEFEIKTIAQLREAGVELANATNGGEGISGFHHTDETKRKQSESNKGKHHFHHTDETKARIQATAKGRKLSEEAKRKISAGNKGVPKSESHRKALSDSLSGKPCPQATRTKLNNKRWITDGVESRFVDSTSPLPNGFRYGRTF